MPRTLFFTLTAAFAEMERGIISERTRATLAHKKALGQCVGRIPYGFALDAESGKLIKYAPEQAILAQIRRLRKRALTFAEIAARLNEKGTFARNGRPWSRVWVDRIAHKYLGLYAGAK